MNNDGSAKTGSYRSKKSVLLIIDVIAIVLSFALALAIRFRILVASIGSHLVITTCMNIDSLPRAKRINENEFMEEM